VPEPFSTLHVAVVHDWLTGMRGGEQVLEAILELFPGCELFTLFHFPGNVSQPIESHPIRTSWLQSVAGRVADYRKLLALFPLAASSWDLSGYDLVVSSSHCVAKGVRTGGKPHLCYCHTPMRYVWDRFDDYFPRSRPLRRLLARPLAAILRRWDRRTAGVSRFLANSRFVQQRIAAYYGRQSDVVHPFAGDEFFRAPFASGRGDYHLVVSALVPYKRVDLAVEAARASGRKLVVIGSGPLLEQFRRQAPPNARFLGYVSTDEMVQWMGEARSLILPGVEDFGIAPIEAMASGTPVVAFGTGGVLDSVVHGESGILFDRFEVESLRTAMDEVERRTWDRARLRAHAAHFSRQRFLEQFSSAVRELLGQTR
jgi:glycosyltransferase involved in cell wall biosynthesis